MTLSRMYQKSQGGRRLQVFHDCVDALSSVIKPQHTFGFWGHGFTGFILV